MQLATMSQVSTAVRNARQERGLTQAQLAAQLGVARDWVIRLEQGNPRLEVQRVLDALTLLGLTPTAGPTRPQDENAEDDPFAHVFKALP